ncbi:unnamed protein product [Clonostachys rhizophaga]|uniref:Zn(2)-C6 fungal-type domain-containing protein n=1 Tax=Clonostachys rhizophaga TaxID=160324 RepID=A0A9N9VTQ1_9HYPO|nr:unnamed protein product [Clonostachys rhizophaga]
MSSQTQATRLSPTGAGPKPLESWNKATSAMGKRRSSKACLSCRNRKVRCDVVRGGVPCNNCRLDNVECIIKESNRGKKLGEGRSRPAVTSPAGTTHVEPASPGIRQDTARMSLEGPDNQQNESGAEDCPDYSQDEDDGPDANHDFDDQDEFQVVEEPNVAPSNTQILDPTLYNGMNMSGIPAPYLPPYIKPLPSHIGPRDLFYLADKDALTIPDDELRGELLRVYVYIVYAFMPAVELNSFLGPILRNDGKNAVSLVLFQAVMYVSVTFVDDEYLQARGYSNRKSARKIFFNRVRLLYGLDCEQDRLTVLQSLLFMTYWCDFSNDEKDTWYWIGVTLSQAQAIGVHRNPETLDISSEEKCMRRRIWWSCLIRDRLLCLAVRRPPRIRDGEFDVPMLTIDDFENSLQRPTDEVLKLLGESGLTTLDADGRKGVALICVELAKLCICIGHVLTTQYSILGSPFGGSQSFTQTATVPQFSEKQALDLAKCEGELEDWLRNRQTICQYSPPMRGSTASNNCCDRITRLHQALLHMIYLNTIGALHRPQAFSPTTSPAEFDNRKNSIHRVKEAAIATTKLAFDLQSENQFHYLSTSSIPAFLSAALIHLRDVCSPVEEVRSTGIGRFYQSIQALHQLQEMYVAAELAIRFLEKVIKTIDLPSPMLAAIRISRASGTQMPVENRNLIAFWGYHSNDRGFPGAVTPSGPHSQDLAPSNTSRADLANFQPALSPSINNIFSNIALDRGQLSSIPEDFEIAQMLPDLDGDGPLPELINFDIDPSFFQTE